MHTKGCRKGRGGKGPVHSTARGMSVSVRGGRVPYIATGVEWEGRGEGGLLPPSIVSCTFLVPTSLGSGAERFSGK